MEFLKSSGGYCGTLSESGPSVLVQKASEALDDTFSNRIHVGRWNCFRDASYVRDDNSKG